MPKVDHPCSTALASAGDSPAQLPKTACSRNDTPNGWPPYELGLEGAVVKYAPMAHMRQSGTLDATTSGIKLEDAP